MPHIESHTNVIVREPSRTAVDDDEEEDEEEAYWRALLIALNPSPN